MVALPGTMPEKFSSRSETIPSPPASTSLLGKRVAIAYKQHIGVPTSCFGETGYWVSDVKVVE